MKTSLWAIALLLFLNSNAALANTLTVGFGQNNSAPYAIIEDDKLVGGIIKDLMDALTVELSIKVVYKSIPRMRTTDFLLAGDIDVMPISNPMWMKKSHQFLWSIPLFEELNLFVVSKGDSFEIKEFSDLDGKKLGTIRGYSYPELTTKFNRNEIFRLDVENLEQNFKKLRVGRIDALIDSDILIRHYLSQYSGNNKFVLASKVASTHFVQSAFSPHISIDIEHINNAFRKMKSKGIIKRIMLKYQ